LISGKYRWGGRAPCGSNRGVNQQDLRAILSSIEQALALLEREPVPDEFEQKTLAALQRLRDEIARQLSAEGEEPAAG
jgi:hypothetical protein